MTDFLNKLATKVISSDEYSQVSGSLFESYVQGLISSSEQLERSDIKKLISSAQIFYMSENKGIRNEGAILLSMMLDICAYDYPEILPIANNVFINSGDFPNIQLLNKRHPERDFKYNFYSGAQEEFRLTLNTVSELNFPLTDFQRSLWEDLTSDRDVITSAPTSAGKTYIILHYILNEIVKSSGAFAVVIVPTRALISEVAGKVYELAKDAGCENEIEICTVPKEGEFSEKTIFVMTQERLHEVLLRGDISFDYLFIDEAHNISDKSRGVLLHLTLEKLLEDSLPQIIISMPSSSYQDSFASIFKGVEFKKEITQNSPVAKIIMSVRLKNRDLVISRNNSKNVKKIPKGFKGTKMADIVYKLGKGQSNIIHRNRTDYCENIANEIADRITEAEPNELLEEAASYVEEFVHKKFSLAMNLRKGVAFHYGPLPSSIRVMVESLVKEDHVKFIACTTTLAEGVNLPAKNLFLNNPAQPIMGEPTERLEDVKINNITGRAGRMLQHFSGNIFLVEPDEWRFQDYFDDELEEEGKIPTYFKSLNEELEVIVNALAGRHTHDEKDQYRIYSIANKLIKEFASDNLENTLSAEELSLGVEERTLLRESVKQAYDALKVAAFTLEANPTVGYIQQNKLFTFLNEQTHFEDWVLPHPKAANLYETLKRICTVLIEAGVYKPSENNTVEHICIVTKKWIQGNSLKEMISEQIEWDAGYAKRHSKNATSINTSVRNVIKVTNNDIRFRLSNALKCYQILLNNILITRGLDISNVKLHAFIEMGACDERMISLINMGLSREAAKEIDDKLLPGETIGVSRDLLDLHKGGQLDAIHAITKKEIDGLFSE